MEPLRTWIIEGDTPLTITVHRPAVTLRHGDGPEVELSPAQVAALSTRMDEAEEYFETAEPEALT